MADYGLKVSQPGFDVKTATPQQLVFTTANNAFPIIMTGTTSLTTSLAVPVSVTINHSLGYVPGILAYVDDGTYTYYLQGQSAFQINGVTYIGAGFWFTMTSTQITFNATVQSFGAAQTYNIRYYLYLLKLA